jgi:alkylresorcinol/alkylpyrone synthase
MLAITEHLANLERRERADGVSILSIATAVPRYLVTQQDVAERAKTVWPQFYKLEQLYANTGIERRYACEPQDWYLKPHGWEERSDTFCRHALDLFERVARDTVSAAGLTVEEIDVLVVNTITGIAVPSLDARLIDRVEFRNDVERLPIFGFGCGGGVAGLSRAARLAQSTPGANVLFLTIDLCSLCLRIDDPGIEMFVSAALFGDGAVGVVLRGRPKGEADASSPRPAKIVATGEHLWRGTERIMGWDMKHDGFGVVLSPELPALMQDHLGEALSGFLDKHGVAIGDFDGFLFHPGGRKVLETAREVLGLDEDDLRHSWSVLRDYGNMSSATALFVLDEAIKQGARGRHLLTAFGPGFSAYFAILEL